MFDNIGQKIKTLAKVFFWIGMISSVIGGVAMMAAGEEELILYGLVIIVVGVLFSWIGNFFIYGFGQLVENSDRMVQLMESAPARAAKPARENKRTPKAAPIASAPTDSAPTAQPVILDNKMFCPHCGEILYVSSESQEGFFCPYCGGRITESDVRLAQQ